MTISTVRISMRAENGLGCSYAIVDKGTHAVLILLRDAECAVFDLHAPDSRYLLLKHYPDDRAALADFYKLIGKMCAKQPDSKYFGLRKNEDNRMVVTADGHEHMLLPDEAPLYAERFRAFLAYAAASATPYDAKAGKPSRPPRLLIPAYPQAARTHRTGWPHRPWTCARPSCPAKQHRLSWRRNGC